MRRPLFLLLVLFLAGCHHRRTPARALPPTPPPAAAPAVVQEDPVPPPIEPEPLPVPDIPPPPREPSPLEQADAAFDSGNYNDAARLYEGITHKDQAGAQKDAVLFHWALSLAIPQNGSGDWTKITAILRQLVDQYPKSLFKPPAVVILNMAADSQKRDQRIKQLSNDLEKLKQIDADRRKRP